MVSVEKFLDLVIFFIPLKEELAWAVLIEGSFLLLPSLRCWKSSERWKQIPVANLGNQVVWFGNEWKCLRKNITALPYHSYPQEQISLYILREVRGQTRLIFNWGGLRRILCLTLEQAYIYMEDLVLTTCTTLGANEDRWSKVR